MGKIRVFVADDHEMVRAGLRRILETDAGLEVVGEASDGQQAVNGIRTLRPDVAMMDIAMPRLNGLEAIRMIRENGCDTRMVILSLHKKDAYVHQAFQCGAVGYLVKPAQAVWVLDAIRSAFRGEFFLSPQIRSAFLDDFLLQLRQQGGPVASDRAKPGH